MIGTIVLSCLFLAARPILARPDADVTCCPTASKIQAALQPLYSQLEILRKQIDDVAQVAQCMRCPEEVALGMEDGTIPDSSLSASTSYRLRTHGPQRARPGTQGYAGCWSAAKNDRAPWIQVDFENSVKITGVMTQGRSDDYDQWVTEYQVAYSQDEGTWVDVAGDDGIPITFLGNNDRNTRVTNSFPNLVNARYLRIKPIKWHNHSSLRFEVYGCRL